MVEQVARAICSSAGRDPDSPFKDRHGRELDFPEWERWRGEARAAIEAMRDNPSQGVLDCRPPEMTVNDARAMWRTMIDAALKD